MPVILLTDLAVRSLKPGLYLDQKTPAFGIRVGKNRKTWIVLKEPNRTKVKIGHYPALSLQDARKKAFLALGSRYVASEAPTFPDALQAFLALDRWKENSKYQLTRNIKRFFTWTKTLDKITYNDVAEIIEKIPKKSQRAHTLKDIKTFFNWCIPRFIPHNPCDGLKVPKYVPRERTLTDDELKATWLASLKVHKTLGAIVRFLILSGARKSEVAKLKWENVTKDTVTFPETKNGRPRTIPLTGMMQAILDKQPKRNSTDYVFPGKTGEPYNGWGKHKADLDEKSGVIGATLHDLRRTFAHNWQRLGARLEITEAALGHVGSRGGIVGVYQTYDYADEMARFYVLWENKLTSLIGDGSSTLRAA